MISKIEGLEALVDISNLNLSDNLIRKVEGLENLKRLQILQLKRNQIGKNGLDDVIGLLQSPSISSLDLSDNHIECLEIVEEVLMKMPNLAVLYLQNNPVCKSIPNYRKTLITKLPGLKYLDDKPVFEDERRFAEAWKRGGLEEERKERALHAKEEEEAHWRRHDEFREMMNKYKKEQKLEEAESSSNNEESLETYNTPSVSNTDGESDKSKDEIKSVSSKKSFKSEVEIPVVEFKNEI